MIFKPLNKNIGVVKSTTETKTPSGKVTRTTETLTERNVQVQKQIKRAKKKAKQTAQSLSNGNEWVQNIIYPQRPTQLPRLIPSRTCPKYHTFDREISTPAGQHGGVIIYPGYHDTIEVYQAIDTFFGNISADQLESKHNTSSASHPVWSVDLDIKVDASQAGQHTIPSVIVDHNSQLLNKEGNWVPGKLAYYPGEFSFLSTGSEYTGVVVYNSDSAAMQMTVEIGSYNLTNKVIDVVWSKTDTIPGHTQAIFNVEPTSATAFTNLTIQYTIDNPGTIGSVPSGMKFYLEPSTANPIVFEGSGVWVKEGLLNNILGSTALTEQIENSDSISFIAMSALLSNISSVLNRGGYVVSAQIPAGSYAHIPRQPLDLFQYISKQVRGPRHKGDAVEGAFCSYTPDKLEEVFFIDTEVEKIALENNKRLRPCIVIAWKAPDEGTNTFNLDFNMCTEIISDDISMEYILGPADVENFMAYFLYLKQRDNHFCENPSHWNSIKDWTKKIVTDPRFKKVAKSCISAGSTALLSLM